MEEHMIKLYSIEPENNLARQKETIIKKINQYVIKPIKPPTEPERRLPRT
jgi:hypothetical protein